MAKDTNGRTLISVIKSEHASVSTAMMFLKQLIVS